LLLFAEDQYTEPTCRSWWPYRQFLLTQAEQDSQIKITTTEIDTINLATALLAMDERVDYGT
jgi:hypothetical protein